MIKLFCFHAIHPINSFMGNSPPLIARLMVAFAESNIFLLGCSSFSGLFVCLLIPTNLQWLGRQVKVIWCPSSWRAADDPTSLAKMLIFGAPMADSRSSMQTMSSNRTDCSGMPCSTVTVRLLTSPGSVGWTATHGSTSPCQLGCLAPR